MNPLIMLREQTDDAVPGHFAFFLEKVKKLEKTY